jgi:hypothetical protein
MVYANIPTKEKEDKKNIVTRRTPPNRYQHIFLGYFYSYNNFGDKEVHCKALLEYNGCARFTIDNISIVTQP